MAELTFTGERFLPNLTGEIWLEHWHRYHFAALAARGARVLDVASGEGYGSALLAATATSVVGVDASADAVAHAQSTYAGLGNVEFVAGDCARLPFADAAFDVIVSFETIEHITAQRAFLAETRRLLAPGGLLLLSSPNKAEYTDRRGYENPYHVAELYRDELSALLAECYPHTTWFGQGIGFCSTILAETANRAQGELVGRADEAAGVGSPRLDPLYFLVGCAATPEALERLRLGYSVLGDPDDAIYRDYRDTYRKFVAASEAVGVFRAREAELERERAAVRASARNDIAFIQERLTAAERQRDSAREETDALRADAERLRIEAAGLRALTALLGSSAHSAQQAALRLTGALEEANRRYAAELAAAQATVAELTAAIASERRAHAEALSIRTAELALLREEAAACAAELSRRRSWLGRGPRDGVPKRS
jgi:SAM-dependent methyltransferase